MDTSTRTVSPNGAKNSITHALKKKRPIFLWGPPGIGKSDIVGQICDTISLLPIPGGPHKKIGRFFFSAWVILFFAPFGLTVRVEVSMLCSLFV